MSVAAAWRFVEAADIRYMTLSDALMAGIAAVLLSTWYVVFGRPSLRARAGFIGALWFLVLILLTIFKPVYNGDVGIHGWRLRFAANRDESLDRSASHGVATDWQTTSHDFPRFLGSGYWPEVSGVQLESDWRTHPPQLKWRHEIGAGWSSFSIVGNYAFTQEQRGDHEFVSCYRLDTGDVVWRHADAVRFDPGDLHGGVSGIGPRATPTIHNARVFSQGATGIVNCLDAVSGKVLWSHDTCAETGADLPIWGKSGSPLVVDELVVVSVGAPKDSALRQGFNSSLLAYDVESGAVRWAAGNRPADFASPLVAKLAGERQIIVVNEGYVTSHRLTDGAVLWEHPWAEQGDTQETAVQPIPLEGDRLLLCKGYGYGISLLGITRDTDGKFSARPIWNPPIISALKSKFSNLVLCDGYLYGLDDVLLECVELETGKIAWKKRRRPPFGHGQILLIGDAILVLSETGELAIVQATPDGYHEMSSIQALDPDDVTWNNMAFSTPYLLVRNAREAACYRLPLTRELEASDNHDSTNRPGGRLRVAAQAGSRIDQ
jgi:outer membrane protein assembly factor BamB